VVFNKGNIMSNTKATGVAYLDPEFSTCYATEEIGYAAGAQGAVTQATSKSTGVTLNKPAGQITLNNSALGANATATFTLTNSKLHAKDVLIVNVGSGGTSGAYWPYVANVSAGSAVIGVYNNTAGSLSEAIVLNFAIFHNE
jgi:threonine dehydratase